MTYSVLARCPRTGQLGIAITSYTLCVGLYANSVRARVGVTMTQSSIRERNNGMALGLLAQGFSVGYVMEQLKIDDPDWDYRQIGIIDRVGNVAAYSGPKGLKNCLHKTGAGYVVLGNGVASPKLVDDMAAAFERNPGNPLEDRLISALEAGRDAGGQPSLYGGKKPDRSAALSIYSEFDYADLDLRVDFHDAAVDELRRICTDYQPYRAYYRERFGDRTKATMVQEDFARMLEEKKRAGANSR